MAAIRCAIGMGDSSAASGSRLKIVGGLDITDGVGLVKFIRSARSSRRKISKEWHQR